MSDQEVKAAPDAPVGQKHGERYLIGLALFTVAQQHDQQAQEFEKALAQHLGYPPDEQYMGHISDALGEGGDFDTAVRKEGRLPTLVKG